MRGLRVVVVMGLGGMVVDVSVCGGVCEVLTGVERLCEARNLVQSGGVGFRDLKRAE